MHILEQYAVNCGAKIDQPFILEEFYPIPFQNYIVLHAGSGMDSKNYDYFNEVVSFLIPYLNLKNIHIIQVGGEKENKITNCYHALGTTKRQIAYIIKNSLLYFGNDTLSLHFASYFQKKIVCASTILYKECFYPYWSKKEDYQIIESHRNNKKPTFSLQENPKTINFIKPEEIALPILKYLNIENIQLPKTLFIGDKYKDIIIESIPSIIIPQHVFPNTYLNIRFDYIDKITEQDYICTLNNLNIRKCAIITDKPIEIEKLLQFKDNLVNIFYDITFNDINFDFINKVKFFGIKIDLIFNKSKNKDEHNLNNKKLELIDYSELINVLECQNKPINKIKESEFYKSKKILFANNSTYLSKQAYLENKSVSLVDNVAMSQKLTDINNIDLLIEEDGDYCYFYK